MFTFKICAALMLLRLASAKPTVKGLYLRQDATSTTTTTALESSSFANGTGTADEDGTKASGGALSMTVIIPVVVILGSLLLLAILWASRQKLFKGRFGRQTSAGAITAEELAAGRRSRSGSTAPGTGGGVGAGADGSGTNGNGAAGASGRARRARRNIRRTESGRSIRTLPEYSKEAGDEELVLVRRRSSSSIEEIAEEEEEEDVDIAEGQTGATVHRSASVRSNTSRRSQSGATSPNEGQEVLLPPNSPPAGSQSAPTDSDPTTLRRTLSNASRRGWGEAPTYLEAMSSPSFPSTNLESGIPPPRLPSLRTRTSSSFRGLLSRAGMTFAPNSYRGPPSREMTQRHSSTSLLLQPQQSRLSTNTSNTRTSRDGSPYDSPWASTHSLHISSPVPNSAIRASFENGSFPRAGLSDDQMRFLSSQEAVNMVGVKMGDVPPNRRRRRSVGNALGDESGSSAPGGSDVDPPTWDEVQLQGSPGRDVSALVAEGEAASASGSSSNLAAEVGSSGDIAESAEPEAENATADAKQANKKAGTARPDLAVSVSGFTATPSLQVTSASADHPPPAVEVEPPTPVHTAFPSASHGPDGVTRPGQARP